jgi:hypothetical protein
MWLSATTISLHGRLRQQLVRSKGFIRSLEIFFAKLLLGTTKRDETNYSQQLSLL